MRLLVELLPSPLPALTYGTENLHSHQSQKGALGYILGVNAKVLVAEWTAGEEWDLVGRCQGQPLQDTAGPS